MCRHATAGISSIVASWFISPICSGIIVFILFGLMRTFVLRSQHSFTRAFYVSTRRLCCCVSVYHITWRPSLLCKSGDATWCRALHQGVTVCLCNLLWSS